MDEKQFLVVFDKEFNNKIFYIKNNLLSFAFLASQRKALGFWLMLQYAQHNGTNLLFNIQKKGKNLLPTCKTL